MRNRRVGEKRGDGEEDTEYRISDQQRRQQGCEGLTEQQLLATDGGGKQRLQGALVAFTDHRVGGHGGRNDGGDEQHVEQHEANPRLEDCGRGGSGGEEDLHDRQDEEEHRRERHRPDHEAVAPVVA